MPKDTFVKWMKTNNILRIEPVDRLFHAMRSEGSQFLVQENFHHMLKSILHGHPGLEFLQETPEFQDRWVLPMP